MKRLLVLIVGLLPASRLKNRMLGLCGRRWSVARSATIHPVLFLGLGHLEVGERSVVGVGNAFRSIASLEMGDDASIGQLNWFSAAAEGVTHGDPRAAGRMVMRRKAEMTSRHYIDCSGGVRFEERAVMGGVRSTILTHSMDVSDWTQRSRPFVLGARSVLFTNSVVLGGATIADDSIVAARALVRDDLDEPEKLYGGTPAKLLGAVRVPRPPWL